MKKGGKFHSAISNAAKFVGKAKLKDFDMYSVNDTFPIIAPGNGVVHGEVYRFYNSNILGAIDLFRSTDSRSILLISPDNNIRDKLMFYCFNKHSQSINIPHSAWVYYRKFWSKDSSGLYNKIKSGIWDLKK